MKEGEDATFSLERMIIFREHLRSRDSKTGQGREPLPTAMPDIRVRGRKTTLQYAPNLTLNLLEDLVRITYR